MVEVEEDVDGLGGVVGGHMERADDVHLRHAVAEHSAHHGHLLLPIPLLPHPPSEAAAAKAAATALALIAPGPRNFSPKLSLALRRRL